MDFEKARDSVTREVFYNILIEIGIPMKLVGLIRMCLNETCIKFAQIKICVMHFLLRMV
jgi:hypothetical protein